MVKSLNWIPLILEADNTYLKIVTWDGLMFFLVWFFFFPLPTVRIRNNALLFVFLIAREGIFMYACENTEFIQVLDEYVRADV